MKNSILLLLISLALWTCKSSQNSKVENIQNPSFEESAYQNQWANIARLEQKGAYKQAQAGCDSILSRAALDQNPNQLFKALAHRSKYIHLIEEDAEEKIINDFEAQIKAAKQPTKAILHSACGELYLHYYERNKWKRRNRSTLEADSGRSLAYWSLNKIMQKAAEHHLKALEEAEIIAAYPIEKFTPILTKQGPKTAYLFYEKKAIPSMYELLAKRSLTFFKQQYSRETKPLSFQKLADSVLFTPLKGFLKKEFRQADQEAADFQTLILYQKVLGQLNQNKRFDALLHFELDRLAWALQENENNKRHELYRNALEQIENTVAWNAEQVSLIKLALAENYQRNANPHPTKNEKNQGPNYLSKAAELAKNYQNDSTFAGLRFKRLLNSIEQSDFRITAENTYPVEQRAVFYVNYRNLDSLHLKLFRIPQSLDQSYQEEKAMALSLWRKRPLRAWSIKLENPNDYYHHSRDFDTEGLEAGRYLLLASSQSKQSLEVEDLSAVLFNISNLSLHSLALSKKVETYLRVNDRKSGKTLEGVKIELIKRKYEASTRHYKRQVVAEYATDSAGQVTLSGLTSDHYQFRISNGKDSLHISNGLFLSSHIPSEKELKRSRVFTDRAVYKAGQLVKLKGIVMKRNEVVAMEKVEVKLLDANNQVIQKQKLTTNEFGSYSTNFLIPKGKLNGTFRLVDNYSQKTIEVAAYKRPSFMLRLNPLDQEVKLGDSVWVSGHIKSYSGFGLAEREIRYRVVEKIIYPYWPFYRSYLPDQSETIIAQGSVLSNSKGNFKAPFKTNLKQESASRKGGIKQYTIEVEATNQAGETQQTEASIRLSNQAIFISTNLTGYVTQEELKNLIVSTKNINGKPLQSNLELSLFKLENRKNIRTNRYWPEPEFGSSEKVKYQNYFTHLPSEEEAELDALKRQTQLLSGKIKSNEEVELFNQIKAGAYELSIETVDQYGKAIAFSQRFVVYDPYSEKIAFPSFLKIIPLKNELLVNEVTKFCISTALNNVPVYYQVEHKGDLIKNGVLWLSKEQKLLSFNLKAAAEPYFVHFQTIRNNRFFQQKERISVKKAEEKLKLGLIQFQSQTEPGKTEKWQLKLRNHEGKPIEAEVLLGMYDQSLDVFAPNDWKMPLPNEKRSQISVRSFSFQPQNGLSLIQKRVDQPYPQQAFPRLNWFGLRLGGSFYGRNALPRSAINMSQNAEGIMLSEATEEDEMGLQRSLSAKAIPTSKPPLRSDFSETAFFFPQLKTNKDGLLSFNFKMPDALTSWKFQAFAHGKELTFGKIDQLVVSQKPLMLVTNDPRFFRSGDKQTFSTSVQNNTDSMQEVSLRLKFFNGFSGRPLSIFGNTYQDKTVLIEPMQSKAVSWSIEVPDKLNLLTYEVSAIAKDYEDRERKTKVVLNNKTLITERQSFTLNEKGVSNLLFNPLIDQWHKEIESESVTFEFTANPKWYVLQALPYLTERSGLRTQEVFHKLFATAIASKLLEQNQSLKETLIQWSKTEQNLPNPLLKNPELKEALIEATPWEDIAKRNSQQAKSLLALIEPNQQAYSLRANLEELAELQEESGAWPWIRGMRSNRYITQEIATGLAQLLGMKAISIEDQTVKLMLQKALTYLKGQIEIDYQGLLKKETSLNDNKLGRNQIQYLYLRSLLLAFYDFEKTKAHQYYLRQATIYWLNRPLMLQAMQAMALKRLMPNSNTTAKEILASLREQAIEDQEGGLYWKQIRKSSYWQEAPIESQALLIEAFSEIMPDETTIRQMKNWLLTQKRVQHWESSKATAYACFALLKSDNRLDLNSDLITAKVGGQLINSQTTSLSPSYIKKKWEKADVKPALGKIEINKNSDQTAWGAMYWQYFEALDQIEESKNNTLAVSKRLFKLVKNERGEQLVPIDQAQLKVGDIITVRLEVNNLLDLEFMHLKDELAAATEPIEQLSGYSRIEGLGYYMHIENASHNFFFERLPRGKYVFEYQLRVNQSGEFESGISKLSSQYAPEFGAHSSSIRLNIKP